MDSPRSSISRSSRRSSGSSSRSDPSTGRHSGASRSSDGSSRHTSLSSAKRRSNGSQGSSSAWESGMDAFNNALQGNFGSLKSFASANIIRTEEMDTGIESFESLKRALNDSKSMQELSVQTGLPPVLLFGIIAVISINVMIACLSIQSLGLLVSRLVGFVYPTYASFKALETKDTQVDDTQWLTYWVTFALLSIAEDVLLHVDGPIPLYLVLKVSFLLWCQLMNGSAFLYTLVIRPAALKVMEVVEDAVRNGLFESDED